MNYEHKLQQSPFDAIDMDDLTNGISIYNVCDVFNCKDECNDINEDTPLETETEINETETETENCLTCYYNVNGRCMLKNLSVSEPSEFIDNCWFYKNYLTLKTTSYFQDDVDYNDYQ